ncbi:54S ribosomal protein img2, mitochondrial [Extremus antarcticus]|uniref:Large ribosomal subunit protein mL49 n=1 Tax=Extremus antarcticus TaxID=702011 RepID=A0AAJ0DJ25_9PEZI|nr:54S ribosomal protein img2, mitochondrial [Extremus antarcticus]
MPSAAPLMPFLRPLGLPRPSTVRQFLSFSTSAHSFAAPLQKPRPRRSEDTNLRASRTASATYPSRNLPSLPRPKISKASRRSAHPPKERSYPTRQHPYAVPTPLRLRAEPFTPLPEEQSAPNLAYFVSRTRSNELPVYHDVKRGGNLKLTLVRKVDGKVEALRDELRTTLGTSVGLDQDRVVVNGVTRQVVIKGHYKMEVERFLRERRF